MFVFKYKWILANNVLSYVLHKKQIAKKNKNSCVSKFE